MRLPWSNATILFAIHHKTDITCERLNGSALSVASEAVPITALSFNFDAIMRHC